jgi:hypothetical protein
MKEGEEGTCPEYRFHGGKTATPVLTGDREQASPIRAAQVRR